MSARVCLERKLDKSLPGSLALRGDLCSASVSRYPVEGYIILSPGCVIAGFENVNGIWIVPEA